MFSLGTAHLFSRSGMLKFLSKAHFERDDLSCPWCCSGVFGEPESSLPLKLGDWGAAPSRADLTPMMASWYMHAISRMNLTMNKSQRRRSVFLLPMKNNWNIYTQNYLAWSEKKIHKVKEPTHRILGLEGALRAQVIQNDTPLLYSKNRILRLRIRFLLRTPSPLPARNNSPSAAYPVYSLQGIAITHSSVITSRPWVVILC